MAAINSDYRWVIIGRHGLYVGQWLTRKDAITQHITDLGKTWMRCRADGDRAVKAKIIWEDPL